MRKILFFIPLFLWTCGGGGSSPTSSNDNDGDDGSSDTGNNNSTPIVENISITLKGSDTSIINLPAYDDDENDELTYTIVKYPDYGTISISGNTVTYTNTSNYQGDDSFSWRASDGKIFSNTAMVNINLWFFKQHSGNNASLHRVFPTSDGGYLTMGGFRHHGLHNDFISGRGFISKFNSNLEVEWTETFNDSNNDYISSLMETSDGNYIFSITNDNLNYRKMIKIDENGSEIWSHELEDRVYIADIKNVKNQGYIAVGYIWDSAIGCTNSYILKVDLYGSKEWSINGNDCTDSMNRRLNQVRWFYPEDARYRGYGYSNGTNNASQYFNDVWYLKWYSTNVNNVYTNSFNQHGDPSTIPSKKTAVFMESDEGESFILGSYSGNIARVYQNGSEGSGGYVGGIISEISKTSDNGFIVATSGKIAKIDNGISSIQWVKNFRGDFSINDTIYDNSYFEINSIKELSNGDFVFVGYIPEGDYQGPIISIINSDGSQ